MFYSRKHTGNSDLSFITLVLGILVVLGIALSYSSYTGEFQRGGVEKLSAALDNVDPETPFQENAANLAEKLPDITPRPGLWVARINAKGSLIEVQLLLTDKGTFRNSVKFYRADGPNDMPYQTKTAAGKYRVKGSNLVFSDITGTKGLFYDTGRMPVTNWDETHLEITSEHTEYSTFVRHPDPEFKASVAPAKD